MELIKRYHLSFVKSNTLAVFNYHNNYSSPRSILDCISDFIYKNTPCSSCTIEGELEYGSYRIVFDLYDSIVTINFNFVSYSGTTSSYPSCSFNIQSSIKNMEVDQCLF